MNTELFIQHLFDIFDDAVFPALAIWLAWLVRRWLIAQGIDPGPFGDTKGNPDERK